MIGCWEEVEELWLEGGTSQSLRPPPLPPHLKFGVDTKDTVPNTGRDPLSAGEGGALETLHQFAGVFKLPGESMGWTDRLQHTINIGAAVAIRQRLWKVPIHRRALVEAELEHMLADQVVEPTKGSWVSPVVLVKKKDGSA